MEENINLEISETNRGRKQIIIIEIINLIFQKIKKIIQKYIDAPNIKK